MRAVLLSLALAAALPAAAFAQQPFGPSVEATLGVSAGGGGTYISRAGGAVDAVLALPVGRAAAGTVVLAVTGTVTGAVAGSDICVLGPADACLDRYPAFLSLGIAAGVQRRLGSGLSSRLMAGPAYYGGVDGEDTFGLQGRADVTRPLAFRTALVASLRASLLPRYDGETLRFASLGVGLRIQ